MRRYWLIGFLLLTGTAEAQRGSYFGFGVSYATYSGLSTNYPQPSLQVGGPVADLELRGTLESLLVAGNLGLDVLYPFIDTVDARLYAGGGVNTRLYFFYPNGFDLRAVFGGEYFFADDSGSPPSGVFGEVRTYLRRLLAEYPTVEGRVGVNLYF